MAPKSSNDNSAYKSKIKLDLEKLKNNQIQNVKVDLTKINIKTLATLLGVLSEDVKLYMKLLTANRYYALNDRTINFLSQGEVDMSATTGVVFGFASLAAADNVSDAEVEEVLDIETEVEIFVVDKNKTRAGGSFFPYINNTIFDLTKYGIFEK